MSQTRVVICDKHGGFGLSSAAFQRLRELGSGVALSEPDIGERYSDGSFCDDIQRDDPLLLRVIDEMGQLAASRFCHLKVVEVPADVAWHIEEYDGREWVAEDHRTWS